ncbi:MerR family transcriptional regulator [Actinoplanes sp. CA-142083]|uniref:MerR family transcriptional regulator n=1 Tax=Actinoplanes sp. CA-142083 TaxID=3239903 RepID=UPI003D8C83CA
MGDEALSAGAVARRLGVAVTTLRTWHQRYGLGPSRHEPGRHRRYTAQDLDRLEVMLRLTSQGVAPAEAAAWARGSASVASPVSPPTSLTTSSATSPGTSPATGRDGGGQAIPLGHAVPAARGLARAAMRLDAPVMRTILERAVADWGVVPAWDDVAVPVLVGIGERYQATQRFVEVEHLISRCVSEVLGAVPRPRPSSPVRVLLAAADEEQHTLPLEALAAALAQNGVPTRMLGGRVPPLALDDAITRTGPAVVVLWSQIADTGDPAQLTRVLSHPHPPLLVAAGGPGWRPTLPAGVAQLTTLAEAANLVSAAAR